MPAVGYAGELTAIPENVIKKISAIGLRHHGLAGFSRDAAWLMLADSDYVVADPFFTLP